MRSPVQLYIRIRRPDGSYPYLRAAFTKTGRLLPHQAVSGGRIISAEEGSYYLRTRNGAKRVWEPVGSEPSVALVRLQHAIAKIQNQDSDQDDAADDPAPSPDNERPSRLLNDAIAEYLQETADHKSKKTLVAYTVALRMLSPSYVESGLAALAQEKPPTEGRARRQATLLGLLKKAQVANWSLSNRSLTEITRKDLLAYCAFLSKTHLLSPRTVRKHTGSLRRSTGIKKRSVWRSFHAPHDLCRIAHRLQ